MTAMPGIPAESAERLPLRLHGDHRGQLQPLDLATLPFTPLRVFTVAGVPPGTSRGGHAHRTCVQLLTCVQGEIGVTLRDAAGQREVVLTPAEGGLLVRPGTWSEQVYRAPGSVLLVLASESFDPESYLPCDSPEPSAGSGP